MKAATVSKLPRKLPADLADQLYDSILEAADRVCGAVHDAHAAVADELEDVVSWLRREESGELMAGRPEVATLIENIRTRLERHEHRR